MDLDTFNDKLDEALLILDELAVESYEKIGRAEKGEYDLEDLANTYDRYIMARDFVEEIKRALIAALTRERGKKDLVPLANGGALELSFSSGKRKWNNEDTIPAVIDAMVDHHLDPSTGEITAGTRQLMREVLDAAGISYWKVTVLRDVLDIDIEDYSEKGERYLSPKRHGD